MKNRTCCFTGHRNISKSEFYYVQQKTEEYIRMMVDRGVIYFGVGGALGFDLLAAKLLFRLRDTDCQNIKVILVYPFEGYTNRWSDRLKEQHKLLLPLYDKTVCVSELCNKEAYLKRNRHLVDNSNYCICYCNRNWGGTAYTIRYAQKSKLKIYNTCDFDIKTL